MTQYFLFDANNNDNLEPFKPQFQIETPPNMGAFHLKYNEKDQFFWPCAQLLVRLTQYHIVIDVLDIGL